MRSSLMTSAALAAALAFAAPALAQSTTPDPAPKPGAADSLEQQSAQPDSGATSPDVTTGSAASGDASSAQTAALPVQDLKGMPVHDASGEEIGEVEDAVTGSGGELERLIVSQGGFMGLGAKKVAIDGQQAKIEGDRVTLELTGSQVSELPDHGDPTETGEVTTTTPSATTSPSAPATPPAAGAAD